MARGFKFQKWVCALTVLVATGLAGENGVAGPSRGGGFAGGRMAAPPSVHRSTVAAAPVQPRSLTVVTPPKGTTPPCLPGQVLVGGRCFCVHPPLIIYHDAFWYPYWWYPFYVYGTYSEPYGLSYDELGKQWGKDLKRGTVTMEQFVAFLQAQVADVPDPLRTDFEHGFRKGYGKKGAAVFAQAMNQAKESAMQKPEPNGPAAPPK
jgi:hypothetical protein